MSKQRIVFIMHKLDIGGAERIVVHLVNHLNRDLFDIHLVLIKAKGAFLKQVKEDVTVHDLNSDSAKKGFFSLLKTLYRLKPDRIFSGIGYLNSLLSLFIPFMNRLFSHPVRWIARETNVVSIINKKEKFTTVIDWLYHHTYKHFDVVICQSAYMQNDLVQNYRFPLEKTVLINNPIDIEQIQRLSEEPLIPPFPDNKINLLAVGALRKQKRFDLLIKTVSQLDDRYHLTLVGGGEEEEVLHTLSKQFNIQDRISFVGHQINPYKFMKHADVILLTSDYEGFPNVLLEANYFGLPIIALGCPGGTAEIIHEHLNGILVPCRDHEKLVQTILLFNHKTFNSDNIRNYTQEHYNLKYILSHYEKVLQ